MVGKTLAQRWQAIFLYASSTADRRSHERVADGDEALHGHGDDQPDREVTDRVAHDVDQLLT